MLGSKPRDYGERWVGRVLSNYLWASVDFCNEGQYLAIVAIS